MLITDDQVRQATGKSVSLIVNAIKTTIEETPPELVADIIDRGIMLAGGGALLRRLDRLISEATTTRVIIADDPLTAVVRGTGVVLEDLDSLRGVLLPSER